MSNNSLMGDVAIGRLRERLEELGWSQADLARAIGASTAVVCRWLSGLRPPSLDMAFRIERSEVGLPAASWVTHAADDADDSGEHPAADVPRTKTG